MSIFMHQHLSLFQVNQQIETNHSMQDKLHADLEHKDMALEIDRDCHEMHNDAIDIKVRYFYLSMFIYLSLHLSYLSIYPFIYL